MKCKLLIVLLLCVFHDGSPFTPGAFEFDLEDSVEGLRHARKRLVPPVGVPELMPAKDAFEQPRPPLLIAPIPRFASWAPVPLFRSAATPSTDGAADDH